MYSSESHIVQHLRMFVCLPTYTQELNTEVANMTNMADE